MSRCIRNEHCALVNHLVLYIQYQVAYHQVLQTTRGVVVQLHLLAYSGEPSHTRRCHMQRRKQGPVLLQCGQNKAKIEFNNTKHSSHHPVNSNALPYGMIAKLNSSQPGQSINMTRWRLKISLTLLTQPFIQAHINENVKVPRYRPLCGEFTGDRWIPPTNGQ